MSHHRVALTGTVMLFVAGIPGWKKMMRYVTLATILVLAIGLSLHRFVWKNSNLDFYTACVCCVFLGFQLIVNHVLVNNCYREFKKLLGFEARTNEEFQKFLNEDETEI